MECLEDGDELVFLYQLTRGKAKSSCAFQLAASNGVDSDVVKRAAEVWYTVRLNIDLITLYNI